MQLRRLKPDGLWWDEMNNSTIAYFLEKSTAFVDHWLLNDLPIVSYRSHAVNAQRAIVGATSKDGVMLTKDRMHNGALIPHSQVRSSSFFPAHPTLAVTGFKGMSWLRRDRRLPREV